MWAPDQLRTHLLEARDDCRRQVNISHATSSSMGEGGGVGGGVGEGGDGGACGAPNGTAGGTLGGISTGQDIDVRIALKPTSSIPAPGRTINMDGEAEEVVTTGRHDPCVGIRAVPIAEAMLLLVLMDFVLRQRQLGVDHEGIRNIKKN